MQTKSGEQESHTHSFDAGAAWACLALQATRMGYHAHGMSGVDFDRVRTELDVPDRFRVDAQPLAVTSTPTDAELTPGNAACRRSINS